MEIKRIDIRDRDVVRALVVESWETILPDIEYIDSPFEISDSSLCDIIGVEDGRLVSCFISLSKDAQGLIGIINSFDWIKQNIKIIKRVYPQFHFETGSIPSLTIISPGFSNEFLKAVSYINLPEISLYRYMCLEVDNGKGIVLDRVAGYRKGMDVQPRGQKIANTGGLCLECLGITREEEKDLLSG